MCVTLTLNVYWHRSSSSSIYLLFRAGLKGKVLTLASGLLIIISSTVHLPARMLHQLLNSCFHLLVRVSRHFYGIGIFNCFIYSLGGGTKKALAWRKRFERWTNVKCCRESCAHGKCPSAAQHSTAQQVETTLKRVEISFQASHILLTNLSASWSGTNKLPFLPNRLSRSLISVKLYSIEVDTKKVKAKKKKYKFLFYILAWNLFSGRKSL